MSVLFVGVLRVCVVCSGGTYSTGGSSSTTCLRKQTEQRSSKWQATSHRWSITDGRARWPACTMIPTCSVLCGHVQRQQGRILQHVPVVQQQLHSGGVLLLQRRLLRRRQRCDTLMQPYVRSRSFFFRAA